MPDRAWSEAAREVYTQLPCDVSGSGIRPRDDRRQGPGLGVEGDHAVHRSAHRDGQDGAAIELRDAVGEDLRVAVTTTSASWTLQPDRGLMRGYSCTCTMRLQGSAHPAAAGSPKTGNATTLAAVVPTSTVTVAVGCGPSLTSCAPIAGAVPSRVGELGQRAITTGATLRTWPLSRPSQTKRGGDGGVRVALRQRRYLGRCRV